MAQAARLGLRMQKELKLLLSDPPPGASFPLLSSSSSSSLSTIDAQIEGPEGTVYAEGIFKIKIQIPERYPFQPPILTFATPIYHPNIDNGGRICLDILNLPPKGAWQPSLNISTVLTSIGLLLSEPNPDDGLMCEASREYKYNRQAFDQKARSMTQKYAMAGENGNDSGSQSIHSHSNLTSMGAKGPDELQCEVNEYFVSHKKLCGVSRKLSLESSVSNQKSDSDKGENEVPIHQFIDQMEVKGSKEESKKLFNEYNQNYEKLKGTRRKLSWESLSPSQMKGGNNKENLVPNQHSFFLNPEGVSVVSSDSLPLLQVSYYHEQQSHQDRDSESINESANTGVEKLPCVGQKLSIESLYSPQISADNDEKLHAMPQQLPSQSYSSVSHGCLPMPQATDHNELLLHKVPICSTGNDFPNMKRKKLGLASKKLSLGSVQSQEKDNKENVVPIQRLPISQPNSLSMASSMSSLMSQTSKCLEGEAGSCGKNVAHRLRGIGCKLSLEPLCQLQGFRSGDTLMNMHTENPTKTPSKSFPMLYDCRRDEKQQGKQEHSEKKDGAIKQEGEGSPISETVIVLDSEDSEEEKNESLKPKLLLARKRMPGKWKAKA